MSHILGIPVGTELAPRPLDEKAYALSKGEPIKEFKAGFHFWYISYYTAGFIVDGLAKFQAGGRVSVRQQGDCHNKEDTNEGQKWSKGNSRDE